MGLRIRLLGAVEAELDGAPVALPPGRRLPALLGWLALHPGGHPRARLASVLWPDVPDASARASLRSALWALRRALGPGGAYLTASRDTVGLRRAGVGVDVADFERLAAAGRLAEAVALCRGDLLYQLEDDWAGEARDQHSERLAGVLGQLARQAAAAGHSGTAVTWARRRAALRPLDEAAGRDLIRRLADADDIPGALLVYERLRQRLAADLGVPPAVATRRLAGRLRGRGRAAAGEQPGPAAAAGARGGSRPGLAAVQGPAAAGGTPAADPVEVAAEPEADGGAHPAEPAEPGAEPAGLAAGEPPLLGRQGEMAVLAAAWQAARGGNGQAVLLTGEGGIGKTCLAGALLARARRERALTVACQADAWHPFGMWPEVLSGILAGTGRPPAGARWAGDLAALLPAFGPPPPQGPRALRRGRLFEAVVALLGWASRERPLALLLDDLHLADGPSLDLLGYAGHRVSGMRVLLILAARPLPPRTGLERALAALRAHGVLTAEVSLAGLPSGTVRKLAFRTARLAGRDAARVVSVAGGNPLLAVAAAGSAGQPGGASAGLGRAVESAERGLHLPARRFLELAALARRDLRRPELAALPLPDPALAATEALGCGLLRQAGTSIGYRHPLLRDAVTDQIPVLLRDRMRDLLADALPPG